MSAVRVLVISGSSRPGSFNRRLADVAAGLARAAGAVVTQTDLRALALPLYDAEIEVAGVPSGAIELRRLFAEHDAVIVASPEYNGFPTPLFVNAFDWLSRVPPQSGKAAGLAATANRPVALLAASPGPLGALRSMNYVRQYLQMAFAMIVVPQQFALARANEAFDEAGGLKDPKAALAVAGVLQSLLRVARALRQP